MTQTRLFCRYFYFLFFSSRVPGRRLRAETFSAVTVCLRTCQPSTEWSLCCFYSHKGCCAVISASLHLPDNSVSKIGAPARQEALFSLPKNKPQDRKRDLGGFRVAAEHIWIVFLLRSLCCWLSKKRKKHPKTSDFGFSDLSSSFSLPLSLIRDCRRLVLKG